MSTRCRKKKNRVRHGAVADMDDLDPRIVGQYLGSPRMTMSDGTLLIRKRGDEGGQEEGEARRRRGMEV